jgi:hypothetical protein
VDFERLAEVNAREELSDALAAECRGQEPSVPFPIASEDTRRDHQRALEEFIKVIERRSSVRFPLELRVRYRILGRGYAFASGWVVNMSSGGVLVDCRHEISAGSRLELDIEWPSLLDGRVPLQLVTVGRVVRSDLSSFAVALGQHQFRTMRKTVLPSAHRAILLALPARTRTGL